jgi:hypothetical protein
VKAGTIFDNILVTDSVAEAEAARAKYAGRKDSEAALEKTEREAKEAEAKAAEAKEPADEDKDDL